MCFFLRHKSFGYELNKKKILHIPEIGFHYRVINSARTYIEANNHINGKRIIIDDKGNNDDIGFIDVFEGKRFKKNPYI